MFNTDFAAYGVSSITSRKSILLSQTFSDVHVRSRMHIPAYSPPKPGVWVFFSSPARAYTEHMVASRLQRPRADDENAHAAMVIIPLNQ